MIIDSTVIFYMIIDSMMINHSMMTISNMINNSIIMMIWLISRWYYTWINDSMTISYTWSMILWWHYYMINDSMMSLLHDHWFHDDITTRSMILWWRAFILRITTYYFRYDDWFHDDIYYWYERFNDDISQTHVYEWWRCNRSTMTDTRSMIPLLNTLLWMIRQWYYTAWYMNSSNDEHISSRTYIGH